VWIVFAAGLGGGQNAAAPGLVFLVVGACALGAWVVVTVRSWLLRVVMQNLTADSDPDTRLPDLATISNEPERANLIFAQRGFLPQSRSAETPAAVKRPAAC